ncbi:MAG TPA: hypothetical protein ENJ45_03520 [Phaeodactylibacter sp.]|nr:hypothetical protein [Phaeodactylibacter sp.]
MQTTNLTYRIIALFMAVLMFVTSVGFTVDIHYCSGEFKSFSLTGRAKSCHESQKSICPHHQKMMAEKGAQAINTNSCCSNKLVHIQSDQDKDLAPQAFKNIPTPKPVVSCMAEYLATNLQDQSHTSLMYRPPLIWRHIPIWIQSFLL